MALLSDPRMDTIVLTSGGMWVKEILSDPGTVWPDGTSYTRFLDTAGGVIAEVDGEVTTTKITYTQPPEETDSVPAGAGFETFLVTADGPYKIRYGKVIRKEVTFPSAATVTTEAQALQFRDTFQRSALGSKWVGVSGRTSIHTNTAPKPKGVGPNLGLLYQSSAIRYFQPFNGDSVKSTITLLNPGAGKTTVILCADQQFTTFLGCQFDTTGGSDHLHIVTGTGPTTMVSQAQATVTIADYDRYTMFYDALSDSVVIYKGSDLTPVLTWDDELHDMPHGLGYRYFGFAWQADLLSTGPQITNWVGQDDVGVLPDGS